ncbi:hypothetical protein DID96_33605 [Burkholderia sp. Bp8963]|nr:hypothetical protein DID96_33605 [Burkholderia sp. Bp8963]
MTGGNRINGRVRTGFRDRVRHIRQRRTAQPRERRAIRPRAAAHLRVAGARGVAARSDVHGVVRAPGLPVAGAARHASR